MIRNPVLSLSIALLLALTSVTLGAARGQVRTDGAVTLCSGAVYLPVDAEDGGGAARPGQICPDMALGLLAAVALAVPDIVRPALRVERLALAPGESAQPRPQPAPSARGPPVPA